MGVVKRGIKNAFRNGIRTFSIVVILGLSIGLALTMLIARQAVEHKINDVKSSIGNSITVSPAGFRGFGGGGGNPLTADQVAKVKALPHVSGVVATLTDRLTAADTNLLSAIDAGSLGTRFGGRNNFTPPSSSGRTGTPPAQSFTPPVQLVGSTDASALSSDLGGGTLNLTSGVNIDGSIDANVAVVGKDLATKNNLTVGSTFQAYGSTVTVKGIFDAGNTFSNAMMVMPLPTVQRLSGQPGAITSAVVQVDSITNETTTTAAITTALGTTADVTSSQDRSTQALAPLENIAKISLLSLFGASGAAAAIILLTMVMIVRERRREVGVLKAIGSGNGRVIGQFAAEALTFTILGSLIGLVVGVIGAKPVTNLLVTTNTASSGGDRGGQFGRLLAGGANSLRTIQADVNWHIVLYGLGGAIAIALVGSVIASVIVTQIKPAEALRNE